MNSNETGRANDGEPPFAPHIGRKEEAVFEKEDPSQQPGLKGSLRISRVFNTACRHHRHHFDRRPGLLVDELR
jgi:hypothetical protein